VEDRRNNRRLATITRTWWLSPFTSGHLSPPVTLPAVIADAGEQASKKFIEFFTATIRNKNTRTAYAQAIAQFLAWCGEHHLALSALEPTVIGAYVEQFQQRLAKPSVKQHLAAVRMGA